MTVCVLNGLRFVGIQSYIVRSGSMEPAVLTGSLCLINTNCEFDHISVDDIIAYKVGNTLVTHRVIDVTEKGLITKGDNNTFHDGLSTTKDNFVGKNIGSIPVLGYILSYLQLIKVKITGVTVMISLVLLRYICTDQSIHSIEND